MTIDEILRSEERQTFERKSVMIEPKALAIPLISLCKCRRRKVVIGISDKTKRRLKAWIMKSKRVNELLRVPFDYCEPTVKTEIEWIPCIDYKRRQNHVIVMHIEPSPGGAHQSG